MMKRAPAERVTHAQILELMGQPDYAPMTAAELARHFGLRGAQRKPLLHLLRQMAVNGELAIIRQQRYALAAPADLVTGRLEVKRSGEGYLTDLTGELDVRIERGNLGTALPGDLVTVRLEPQHRAVPPGVRHGTVVRILERAKRILVGTLKFTGRFHYVVPLDPAYQQDFYVADPGGARVGDRVVVRFTQWENRHVNPEAEILEVIGPASNPSLDTLAIIRHFELRDTFPEAVLLEAADSGARLTETGRRLDLRDRFVFTVDPATARDFDDALSLERDEQGRRVLGVHIADVSHFVRRGSALDREALERGNSVYLPDKVLPMLPEALSNGLCSLNPGQERLTFSVFLTVDAQGRVVHSRFARSIIRSSLRLTYEQALRVIQTPPGMRCREPGVSTEAAAVIREIANLAQQLRRGRLAQFALDLEIPEYEVVLGEDSLIRDIRPVGTDVSHQMIEECMVAANEAVDRELSRHGWVAIHRVHEPPAEDKISMLAAELRDLGYHPGDLRQRRILVEFVRSIRATPLAHHIQRSVLRSLKRAVYSTKRVGHFGLAKKYYTHFTSPIRRYPDLVVHRMLAAVLEGRSSPYTARELERISEHCSETEQTAEEAERELLEIKKYRFLEQQLKDRRPQVYDAAVVKVMNFGMFVELLELDIQGLVHVAAISERFVRFDPAHKALRVGPLTYRAGTKVRVYVTGVDFDKRRIDFALEREAAGERMAGKRGGMSRRPKSWRAGRARRC